MHLSRSARDTRKLHPVRLRPLLWALAGSALFSASAMAHHVMGAGLPATFAQGLLSGLGHPIIGFDHFLFVLALGVLCWRLNCGWRAIASFVGASLLGIALHLASLDIPRNESLVALSVLAVGLSLGAGGRGLRMGIAPVAAMAGLFHGYAYGESIVGAQSGVLLAYLLGLVAVQALVGAAGYWSAKILVRRFVSEHGMAQWLGALVSMTGAGFLLFSFG